MPILPFIADNPKSIEKAISLFNKYDVDYIIPSGMSLFGEGETSSRGKYFALVKKHFPEYLEDTKKLYYNKKTNSYDDYPIKSHDMKVYKNVLEVSKKYNIKNSIL